MNPSALVPLILALVAKAPAIYQDVKSLVEMLASGKEPTSEQLQQVRDIIARNEIDVDKA